MGRLIEIETAHSLPTVLDICIGDLLVFDASGGSVLRGGEVVELLGAFMRSILGDNQQVLSPLGAPNAVVFLARHPGSASINLVIGEPWQGTKTIHLELTVS
jgi:GMP synthase-like glutamine amidotransferase